MFGSLVLAMVDRFDFQFHLQDAPAAPSAGELLTGPMLTLVVGLVGATILGLLLMRLIPTTHRLGGMILVESLPAGGSFNENKEGLRAPADHSYVGRKGVVSADLRPAGKGIFEGQLWDIVADGEFIEEGTKVKVIKHEGSRIVVERVG